MSGYPKLQFFKGNALFEEENTYGTTRRGNRVPISSTPKILYFNFLISDWNKSEAIYRSIISIIYQTSVIVIQ